MMHVLMSRVRTVALSRRTLRCRVVVSAQPSAENSLCQVEAEVIAAAESASQQGAGHACVDCGAYCQVLYDVLLPQSVCV